MTKIFLLILSIFLVVGSSVQPKPILSELYNAEQQCIHNDIPKGEINHYSPLLKFAKDIRPKVFDCINERDPQFFSPADTFNLVEGFQPSYTAFFGFLWKSDTAIYIYTFNWVNDATKTVQKVTYSQLNIGDKEIIESFGNWRDIHFSHKRADMYSANDGQYRIGLKYFNSQKTIAECIAFYL